VYPADLGWPAFGFFIGGFAPDFHGINPVKRFPAKCHLVGG
jgi:hypothetical protein